MLKINTRYIRTAPNGDESIAFPKTEDELKYQESYVANGFTFKEVAISVVPEATCFGCEG